MSSLLKEWRCFDLSPADSMLLGCRRPSQTIDIEQSRAALQERLSLMAAALWVYGCIQRFSYLCRHESSGACVTCRGCSSPMSISST